MGRANSPPSCLVVQHVAIEGPYAIGDALGEAGVHVDLRRIYLNETLPADLAGHAAIVVMGGPMSAGADDGFPTRHQECGLLSEAVERGLPTLGVCLGAQLLALAAGALVVRGEQGPEIGWGSVQLTAAASEDPLLRHASPSMDVLHWHGDTFTLPRGAQLLASTQAYPHQAFRVGDAAWGLQFHAEVDESAVESFVREFAAELATAGQTPAGILGATSDGVRGLATFRRAAFRSFAALVADASVEQLDPGIPDRPGASSFRGNARA